MGRYRRLSLVTASALLAATVGTAAASAARAADGPRLDLRVLVVTDGGPTTAAIVDHLVSEGLPYREIDLNDANRPVINAEFLAGTVGEGDAAVPHGRYQAVVLPNANPFGNSAELAALTDYERRFGVRQVDAYVWPHPGAGLTAPTYAGPLDGTAATVTPAGAAGGFGYLRGAVPFEDNAPGVPETHGFLAQPAEPVAGSTFTPLLTAPAPNGTAGNVLIGDHAADGLRRLVLTFSYNANQQQFRLLAPGIVAWATQDVHLGLHRNFFSVHVDDVFLPDSRWSTTGNCTPGEDCPATVTTTDIRMTPADVAHATAWQQRQQFTLDLAFNAGGSIKAIDGSPTAADPLTDALLAAKAEFRWMNHTLSHAWLGCVRATAIAPWTCQTEPDGAVRYTSRAVIEREIRDNITWANAHGLPLDPGELVTGEHSGLRILPQQPADNPNLAPALGATDITWLAADNSRMPAQLTVGSARTVPRHPLNVFFNVATEQEQVDQYNWIYNSRADGGSGICERDSLTVTCGPPLDTQTGYAGYIVPLETRLALTRILDNDPRPHFVHQSNLAEHRLIFPLLDSVLGGYRALLADNTPIVNRRMSASGTELQRQAAWAVAVKTGAASAYLQNGRVVVDAPAGVDVPLTVPEGSHLTSATGPVFGEAYAGKRSAWAEVDAVNGLTVALPGNPVPPVTVEPGAEPTVDPPLEPTAEPTARLTAEPTAEPTEQPSKHTSVQRTAAPAGQPIGRP